jgi:hypothetical protein
MSPDRQLLADVAAALVAAAVVDPETNAPLDADTIKIDYLPRFTPEDLKDLRVVVAPRQNTSIKISRSTREFELGVQVAVMQTASPDSERFAQLLDLTASLDDALASATLDSGVWSRSEVTLYDVQALEQHGAFRSVITVYFKYR